MQQGPTRIYVQKRNYVVLLNLDISSSMSGQKFQKVRESVNSLLNVLGQGDYVGCICFNDKIKFVNDVVSKVQNGLLLLKINELGLKEINDPPFITLIRSVRSLRTDEYELSTSHEQFSVK